MSYQTGDLKNNVQKLKRLIERIKFPGVLDYDRITAGSPTQLLAVLHFVLLDFSPLIAREIADKGYDLYGRTDRRFIEGVFRIMIDQFNYRPPLTFNQFLTTHFIEPKIIFTCETIQLVWKRHKELHSAKTKSKMVWRKPYDAKSATTSVIHANLGVLNDFTPRERKTPPPIRVDSTSSDEPLPRPVPLPIYVEQKPDSTSISNQQQQVDEPKRVSETNEETIASTLMQMASAIGEVNKKLDDAVNAIFTRFESLEKRIESVERKVEQKDPIENTTHNSFIPHWPPR